MQTDKYLRPFEDPGIGMMEANEISLVRCALRDGISMFQVGLGLSENVVPQCFIILKGTVISNQWLEGYRIFTQRHIPSGNHTWQYIYIYTYIYIYYVHIIHINDVSIT